MARPNNYYDKACLGEMAIPVGFEKPRSLEDQIREIVRSERLSQLAASNGAETFDDADDFDVEDEDSLYEFDSPYELNFDPGITEKEPKTKKKFKEEVPIDSKSETVDHNGGNVDPGSIQNQELTPQDK